MEWISVKDKMPEQETPVLVSCTGYEGNIGKRTDIAFVFENRWYYLNRKIDDSDAEIWWETVTHWMPLPSPAED